MSLEWEQVVVDARDPVALGRWWREALQWVIVNDHPADFEIRPRSEELPGLIFEPVAEHKHVKNRLHLDLRPDDQNAEVERLIALGASRVDIGQGDVSWVVLADPEGNEFCVLSDRRASDTVRAAAEALRRQRFAHQVADELASLRNDAEAWERYVAQADHAVGDGLG
ncbi:MAG TPA: VOC family protein [Ilumatobacteraceae bacterium]